MPIEDYLLGSAPDPPPWLKRAVFRLEELNTTPVGFYMTYYCRQYWRYLALCYWNLFLSFPDLSNDSSTIYYVLSMHSYSSYVSSLLQRLKWHGCIRGVGVHAPQCGNSLSKGSFRKYIHKKTRFWQLPSPHSQSSDGYGPLPLSLSISIVKDTSKEPNVKMPTKNPKLISRQYLAKYEIHV